MKNSVRIVIGEVAAEKMKSGTSNLRSSTLNGITYRTINRDE